MGACNKEAAPQQKKKCDDDFDTFVHLQLQTDVSVCNHVQGPEYWAKLIIPAKS